MPRVTQYIRDEDLDAWNAIGNKSEWIHNHLSKKIIKTVAQAQEAIDVATNKLVDKGNRQLAKLCKVHHTPLDSRGKCLQKGCKYA